MALTLRMTSAAMCTLARTCTHGTQRRFGSAATAATASASSPSSLLHLVASTNANSSPTGTLTTAARMARPNRSIFVSQEKAKALQLQMRRGFNTAASASPSIEAASVPEGTSAGEGASSSGEPVAVSTSSPASQYLTRLPKAIIFDMDGTLVDFLAPAKKRLVEARGREYTQEVHESVLGLGMGAYLPVLKQVFGWSDSLEELTEEMRQYTNEIVHSGKDLSLPGAHELIELVESLSIPTAVASSASHRFLTTIVETHGWNRIYPDHLLVGGDDVPQKKPSPDAYLRAAEILKVAPRDCVAIEDSVQGGTAALEANMTCFGVPDFDDTPRSSFHELESRGFLMLDGKLPELNARLREIAEAN